MKIITFLLSLGFGLSLHAGTLFDQLCAFNPNWSKYSKYVPAENARVFLSDKQYIQAHLELVIGILKKADLQDMNGDQRRMRTHLITVLSDYRLQGIFPLNYYRSERIPVFIDEHNTHCAVGYLMRESGYGNLALQISKTDNYVWVKDLEGEQVTAWQQLSGFTLEELKLIQGAYDTYMPFALDAPNRIEIPQKPEVIALNFDKSEPDPNKAVSSGRKVWIRGEGKNGVLHGRWEQNYSFKLPWIVGFYQHGKREGKWLEYYRGTNQLCRTEHWKDDQLNGIRTRFDRDGNVIEEILFENGAAVVKTNYDLGEALKFVRKPIRDSLVWTEIYDLGGNRIAAGHELIHNPGNLQWFQNIELTALNTMMLSSQSQLSDRIVSVGSSNSGNEVQLFEEPPLVEYIKQGDWVYYADPARVYGHMNLFEEGVQLFAYKFNHFGMDLLRKTNRLGMADDVPEFDSVHVAYVNGNVHVFNGFHPEKQFKMELEWYPELLRISTEYDLFTGRVRGLRGKRLQSIPFDQLITPLKSVGFVNEHDEKIGKWQHFNPDGQLARVEEFILPEKKVLVVKEDQ